jgi:hypothetical protein
LIVNAEASILREPPNFGATELQKAFTIKIIGKLVLAERIGESAGNQLERAAELGEEGLGSGLWLNLGKHEGEKVERVKKADHQARSTKYRVSMFTTRDHDKVVLCGPNNYLNPCE